jgi:hypothetical protein
LPEFEASDDALSALAERRSLDSTDPVLRALGAWAANIDARPLPPPVPAAALFRPVRSARKTRTARWALGLTAGLTVWSTGIATANDGSPWSQLRDVTKQVYELGHHDPNRLPDWMVRVGPDLSGHGTSPKVSRSTQRPGLRSTAPGDAPGRPAGRLGVK